MNAPPDSLPRGALFNVAGPSWLGNFFHNILAGILILQVYMYYVSFAKDHWGVKTLVYGIFLIELVQTIIRAVDKFEIDVMRYGDVAVLSEELHFWFSTPIMTAIAAAIAQTFYGYRIQVFSKSWIIPLAVWIPTLVQLGSGIALGILSEPISITEGAKDPKVNASIITWVISTAITDVLIAVLLTYFLRLRKSGIQETDDLVTKIIRLTVETGTVTAIWSILIIILFFQKPPWFVIFADTIGKLYANCMMVMFNRRVNYSEQASTVHHQSMGTIAANTSSGGGESRIDFGRERPSRAIATKPLGEFQVNIGHERGAWELSERTGKDGYV
ncbi:hypothetical protein DL96DRAFT_556521 [Flagelloscypha sp. PMI_526]|nr:hypothetical protein DL96DRAFT_556521 [Flagelloscypha sp. PMI_526]